MKTLIEYASHLLHVLVLTGSGVLISEGKLVEAIQCAIAGAACVIILASAQNLADAIKQAGA